MYPCDKKTLEQLLALIDKGECTLALETWTEYRQNVTQSCADCPYTDKDQHHDCCMCLEGKLRTLSLYEHGEDNFEHLLLNAARKLNEFHCKAA